MKYPKIILCFLIAGALSGCTNTSAPDTDRKQESVINEENSQHAVLEDIPAEFNKEDGRVNFHTAVNLHGYTQQQAMVSATVCCQKADRDAAFDILWRGEPYTIHEYDDVTDEYGEASTSIYYWVEGTHSGLNMGPKSSNVSYAAGFLQSYAGSSFHLEKEYEGFNADKYSLENQLGFMTRENAFTKLEDALSKMGFAFDKTYHAYALDSGTMSEEEYHMDMDGNRADDEYKEAWTSDDDCYYFCIRQTYNGLPLHFSYYEAFPYYEDAYTPIQALLSKDGIDFIMIDKIFEITSERTVDKLADWETVIQTVSDKYNRTLSDSTYEFTEIDLCYLVDVMRGRGTYELNPGWIFTGIQDDGSFIQVLVDAQTGNEVVWK